MSETKNNKHVTNETEKQKDNKHKKLLLYGILLVLVVLVGYVLLTDDKKMYRLTTEVKQNIGVQSTTSGSSSSGSSGSSSSSSSNPLNLGLFDSSSSTSVPNMLSPTSSSTSVGLPGVKLSATSTGGASEVRRELEQLFHAYV